MHTNILVELKKAVLLTFVLVLQSTAMIWGFMKPVESDWAWTETVYIRADGSVAPDTAPISTVDNITYTFTDNIVGNVPDYSQAIVVQKDNVVIEGKGFTLQGTGGQGTCIGIDLTGRNNITIENMTIRAFFSGIWLNMSSNNISLSRNIITDCFAYGIYLYDSQDNTIVENNVTSNDGCGIWLMHSSNNNHISGDSVTINGTGIRLIQSSNNTIYGNKIVRACALTGSSGNRISGNNITNTLGHCIMLDVYSNNNTISENNIADSLIGINIGLSNDNNIYGNNIMNNDYGIKVYLSSNNTICHNNLIDNTQQVYDYSWDNPAMPPSINFWDDWVGKGNCWSDYEEKYPNATELDDSGIWDTPYVIDENNQDNYPIVSEFPTWTSMLFILILLTVALTIYKRRLLKTPVH